MRYRLLQELPRYKVGEILDTDENDQLKLIYCFPKYHPDFFEPIPDEPKRWKPKKGEHYWMVSKRGLSVCYQWSDSPGDDEFYEHGNCFRTREQSLQASKETNKLFIGLHEKWGE